MSKANKARAQLLRVYGQSYTRMSNCLLDECWYCNSTRETLDHCPPLQKIDYINLDRFREEGGKLLLIPSCAECNSILGSKSLFTPEERLAHLYEAYNDKVDKFYLGWSEDEIDELGPTLQRMVIAKQAVVNDWIGKARRIENNIIKLESDPMEY